MRGTHWGKGTIGLQAAVPKRPHTRPLTFFLSASIMAVEKCLKNVESENKILYETLLDIFYSETVLTF